MPPRKTLVPLQGIRRSLAKAEKKLKQLEKTANPQKLKEIKLELKVLGRCFKALRDIKPF